MEQDIINKAKELLERVPYLTLATVSQEGEPNNSPVYGVHDDEYNFFWNSSSVSAHSQNIVSNGKVAVVVYDTSVPVGAGFGVYMDCIAKELNDISELEHAMNVFYTKSGKNPKPIENFMSPNTQRFYKLIPKKVWVNQYDKTKNPPDYKVEINLK